DLEDLLVGAGAALLEPPQLVVDLRRRDLVTEHLRAVDQHHGTAGDHPRRDADAFQALHTSSPKPERTSATSASTASRSSLPSAEMVMVEPRAAASSRMPMMLLPSISRRSRATLTRASNRAARCTNFAA